MKWYWKLLIALGSLMLLVVLLNIGLNWWVTHKLPTIINKENDSKYYITYNDLNVSLLTSSIKAKDIVIVPKASLKDTVNKAGIYGNVSSLEIKNFKLFSFLFSEKLKAKSIVVDQPKVVLYDRKQKATVRESVVAPFDKVISVSDVYVTHGDFKIIDVKHNRASLSIYNVNFNLDGIVVSESILKEKIPFQFRDYVFKCDSVYYHPNDYYHLQTKQLKATKDAMNVAGFKMLPSYSRPEFVAKMKTEKDIYTLLCDSIKVSQLDWGFNKEDLYVHCKLVNLHQASANIYRSKEPADDLRKKHLYNTLLRELQFDLKVDTVAIKNSVLEYEEEKSFEFGAGKLRFTSFNLMATNVNSGFRKNALPDLEIKIDCRFMNDSPFHVNWKLNVMDETDGFNINGRLTNFEAEKIIPFSKPYLNVTTKGIIDEVRFNFTGNDNLNKGTFKVKYDDLKFTIYKKDDRKKKNKVLTFVANIFVKKDSKDKLKETEIEVQRIPEKSFYNFFWRSIQEGLKKILV